MTNAPQLLPKVSKEICIETLEYMLERKTFYPLITTELLFRIQPMISTKTSDNGPINIAQNSGSFKSQTLWDRLQDQLP